MKNIKSFIVSKLSDSQIDRLKWLGGNFKAYFAKRRNVGKNTYIEPSVHVLGWGNVKIGENSVIGQDTTIVINKREPGKVSVIIGDNCFIGRRNFLTAGGLIKIGDYAMISNDCRILGSGHLFDTPFMPYIATGTTCDDVIELGANCWLGANTTLLKGVKVGYGSIIGAGSVVNCDIPPCSVVVGNPSRIVKRFDMQSQTWVKAKDYPEDSDKYIPSEAEYLEILKKKCPTTRMPIIAVSKTLGDLE
ncbi:acyltransferase [Funiculus sociatus GB2-A5]|jgi:acetyltransferase-like isoleucine patch superfamily enzyme|uniref:Acyltransferase n=1 Tax=Funiculus sociatus GB2-A5 TaxID=2933946 RepID=A0ABV0JSE0_9CYAN|nr:MULTISPECIES: acyltransferase [unclassified Trichocoleus]MBD1908901.1 acyltransferase [Trichocoleus sp. FACHB-832]MBD2002456.1 acyltransferase [Trichocoleus sp. FACHB-40]MBD2064550.1 acyltransferase [Trichocoleus sp. FACHB-6]